MNKLLTFHCIPYLFLPAALLHSPVFSQTFVPDQSPNLPPIWNCSGDWTDYDHDGDMDLLISGDFSGPYEAKIYRNDGNSTFTDMVSALSGTGAGSVAWGDYNNDALTDLIITGYNGLVSTKLYKNHGANNFVVTGTFPELTTGDAEFGDYDGDWDLDLVISGLYAPPGLLNPYAITKIYRNDGNDIFTDINANLKQLADCAVDWGDIDNDGDLDLLICGSDSTISGMPYSVVYRNDGNNTFTDLQLNLTGLSFSPTCKWGDYNHDGLLDFFITGRSGVTNFFQIYKNTGGGNFSFVPAPITGGPAGDADWGDFDNDSLLDIVVTGNDLATKVTHIYHNDGNDVFSLISQSFPGINASTSQWVDYTGDGLLDFVIAGENNASQPITQFYKQVGTTGITNEGESKDDVSMIILPNTIQLHASQEILSVSLHNMSGQLLFISADDGSVTTGQQPDEMTIPLERVPGSYILTIHLENNQMITKRFQLCN